MSDIIDILKNAPEYIGGNGRTDTEIETAEKQLGIKFSPDYRCYLKDIGLACFDGHELTGICKSARLNVVDVTLLQRQRVSDAYFSITLHSLRRCSRFSKATRQNLA